MKFKTTNKAVNEGYCKVKRLGYCAAQYLLSFESPVAYTAGVYGWNSDIYDFGSLAISTGYRPTGDSVDYETVNRYEKQAHRTNDQIAAGKAEAYRMAAFEILHNMK